MDKLLLRFYRLSLPLLVLLFPFANSDLFYLVIPKLYPARGFLIVLVAVSLLALFFQVSKKRNLNFIVAEIRADAFLKIVLGLFLVRVVSLIMSRNLTASLLLLAFFASMITMYVILKWVGQRDFNFINRLYYFHLAAVSLVGVYGLLQAVLLIFHYKLPGVLLGGTFLRVPGTFYDANHLPAYLLTGLPLILVLGWTVRRIIVRRLLLILSGLLGFVVLLSFSRSGFAGIALSFAVIFIYAAWRGYWQKVAQLSSLILVIGFIIFLSSRTQLSFANRLLSSFSGAEKSTVAHVALLYGEFKLFIDHPILGVGYGSFSEYFRSSDIGKEHAIVDPATQVRIPPHSLWLEALTETGIIGFALYLALMILVLESLYKALRKVQTKKSCLYLVALLAGFVGINFASIFYSYNLEFFWFFLIYAYLVSQHFLKDEERAEPTPPAS
ncbi:MAG: O-antigen ligase family protein, partial [bacterium]|nr:O-antigen ligase family protein [bacterium]